jgi:glutamate dehydrogenase
VVTNEVVNRAGITFCFRMREETGASFADICRAFIIAREVFAMPALWRDVESLDNVAHTSAQIEILLEARKLGERAARWLLRNRARPLDIAAGVAVFRDGVADMAQRLPALLGEQALADAQARAGKLAARGVPDALAQRVSGFDELFSALDIVSVASDRRLDAGEVAQTYLELGRCLGLDWLRACIVALPRDNRWQTLARTALRDDLYACKRVLTADVLGHAKRRKRAESRVKAWIDDNADAVARCQQVLADLQASGQTDFAMLSVAMGEIRALQR